MEMKEHTERYVRKILGILKKEKLFASQGGPIILGQVYVVSKKSDVKENIQSSLANLKHLYK